MWKMLTENPYWDKKDYLIYIGFNQNDVEWPENECYFCSYDSSVYYRMKNRILICGRCPGYFGPKHYCESMNSAYLGWMECIQSKNRRISAEAIWTMPIRYPRTPNGVKLYPNIQP